MQPHADKKKTLHGDALIGGSGLGKELGLKRESRGNERGSSKN